MSKAIQKEEARKMFLDQCKAIANFWANESRTETSKEKIEGAICSIMNIFDGTCMGFPAAIDLVLRPHPSDKQWCKDNDKDWVVDGQIINDDCLLHRCFRGHPCG